MARLLNAVFIFATQLFKSKSSTYKFIASINEFARDAHLLILAVLCAVSCLVKVTLCLLSRNFALFFFLAKTTNHSQTLELINKSFRVTTLHSDIQTSIFPKYLHEELSSQNRVVSLFCTQNLQLCCDCFVETSKNLHDYL